MKKTVLLLSALTSMLLAESFELGQINVLNTPIEESPFEEVITSKEIEEHNSETLSQALDNMSGINRDVQGGRGESTLYIRGFNAQRIGVFIDGVPVYVPYDGNFDYDRFLTADIAEIDVSKGYSSIAYGANTMGGVINVISKKPAKTVEGNIKADLYFDSAGKFSRYVTSLNAGTRLNHFYAQLGAAYSERDHFRLSNDYVPTTEQPAGDRLQSANQDQKVSFKTGYVADDNSEISLSYANQQGEKEQPPATDLEYSRQKYWEWPIWDKETLSVAGQKNFGSSYLKAVAYYDTITNSLFAYDDSYYTTMNKGSSFKSRYEDYSIGARLEYGLQLGDHFLTAAANYKKDVHEGYDLDMVTGAKTLTENYADHTISFGLEEQYTISSNWELLAGASYDRHQADTIYDTNTAYLDLLDLQTQSAFNPEAALIYSPDTSSKIRASVAQKSHMPSMKERYSRRLNQYAPNPDLQNEKATHLELSYQKRSGGFSGRINGFYTRVDDAIQSVVFAPDPSLEQNQNVGSFDHIGTELEFSYKGSDYNMGANYTYISIKNRNDSDVKIIDVPKHQLFVFAKQELGAGFAVYGDMKFRKGAYEQKLDGTYVVNPSFTTFGLKAIYKPTETIAAEAGIKNLTDELVRYDMAFPMAGREYFATLGYKF
jgi:iron complex outermembrane receptor protein